MCAIKLKHQVLRLGMEQNGSLLEWIKYVGSMLSLKNHEPVRRVRKTE